MSTNYSNTSYLMMLKHSTERQEQWHWLEETLEEAAQLYGEEQNIDAGLEDAMTVREDFRAYVLENRATSQRILGFEAKPVLDRSYGTGFRLIPEDTNNIYDNYKSHVMEALNSEV